MYCAFSSSRTTQIECVTALLSLCASDIAPVSIHNSVDALVTSRAMLVKLVPSWVYSAAAPPQPAGNFSWISFFVACTKYSTSLNPSFL